MSAHTSAVSPIVDSFKLTPADHKISLRAIDLPGPGGAYHVYEASGLAPHPFFEGGDSRLQIIAFQQGVVENDTPNGLTIEALLAICKHRLDCFQAGPYPSIYNERALIYIEQAMAALQERTRQRINAGVEGKMKVDPVSELNSDAEALDEDLSALEQRVFDDIQRSLILWEVPFPLDADEVFMKNAVLSNLSAQYDFDEEDVPQWFTEAYDTAVYKDLNHLTKDLTRVVLELQSDGL